MTIKRPQLQKLLYLAIPTAVFFLASAYITLTSKAAEADAQAMAAATKTEEPRLDTTLRDDMTRALNPDSVNIPESFYNPFVDRTGSNKGASAKPPSIPGNIDPRLLPAQLNLSGTAAPAPQQPQNRPYEERFREWQRKGREQRERGETVTPRTSIYSITELKVYGSKPSTTPGKPGGGWFLFNPEGQAFPAPIGTRFLDAELINMTREGAVFQPLDQTGRPKGKPVTIPYTRESK